MEEGKGSVVPGTTKTTSSRNVPETTSEKEKHTDFRLPDDGGVLGVFKRHDKNSFTKLFQSSFNPNSEGANDHETYSDYEERYKAIDEAHEKTLNDFSMRLRNLSLVNTGKKFERSLKSAAKKGQDPTLTQFSKISPKLLELWINEILENAEVMDIPGLVTKPAAKKPLFRYGLDRYQLTELGVSPAKVDRVFRGLFVYSIGFYEMTQNTLSEAKNYHDIMGKIWRVYTILLEYTCKTDYRTIISLLSTEFNTNLADMENQFQMKVQEMVQTQELLEGRITSLEEELGKAKEEKGFECLKRLQIEDQLTEANKVNEDEIELRVKFEAKLNNMFSTYQDLEVKYKGALDEVRNFQSLANSQYLTLMNMKYQLQKLLKEKVQKDTAMNNYEFTINHLNSEMKSADIFLDELKERIEKMKSDQGGMHRKQNELIMALQKAKAEYERAKESRNVLEMEFENGKMQKALTDRYLESVQEEYDNYRQSTTKDLEHLRGIEKLYIALVESDKWKTEKITELRQKLEQSVEKCDNYVGLYELAQTKNEALTSQGDENSREIDLLRQRLENANKINKTLRENYHKEVEKTQGLTRKMRDKQRFLDIYSMENSKFKNKIYELETLLNQARIQSDVDDRENELNRDHLMEKLDHMTKVLDKEKNVREIWMRKFQDEQKKHSDTLYDNMKLQHELNEMTIEVQNMRTDLDTEKELDSREESKLQKIEMKRRNLEQNAELLQREFQAIKAAYNYVDEKYRAQMEFNENKNRVEVERLEETAEQLRMRIEDLHSTFGDRMEELEEAKIGWRDSKMDVRALQANVERLQDLKLTTEETLREVQFKYEQAKIERDMLKGRSSNNEQELDDLKYRIVVEEKKVEDRDLRIKYLEADLEDYAVTHEKLEAAEERIATLMEPLPTATRTTQTYQLTYSHAHCQTELTLAYFEKKLDGTTERMLYSYSTLPSDGELFSETSGSPRNPTSTQGTSGSGFNALPRLSPRFLSPRKGTLSLGATMQGPTKKSNQRDGDLSEKEPTSTIYLQQRRGGNNKQGTPSLTEPNFYIPSAETLGSLQEESTSSVQLSSRFGAQSRVTATEVEEHEFSRTVQTESLILCEALTERENTASVATETGNLTLASREGNESRTVRTGEKRRTITSKTSVAVATDEGDVVDFGSFPEATQTMTSPRMKFVRGPVSAQGRMTVGAKPSVTRKRNKEAKRFLRSAIGRPQSQSSGGEV